MPVPRAPAGRFGDRAGELRHRPGDRDAVPVRLHAPGITEVVAGVGAAAGRSTRRWQAARHRVVFAAHALDCRIAGYDTRAFAGTLD